MKLQNKNAIITGGSRGIGKAIAYDLAKNGANVALTYLSNQEEAQKVKESIENSYDVKVAIFQLDVRSEVAIQDTFKSIFDSFGSLDVLINNAGINAPIDFDKTTLESWNNILSVNLTGPFLCSKEIIPYMNNNGSIIHIGSVSGQYGGPRTAHYASSKAGLISLSQVIGRFLANKNIRSNVVSAGLIASEMAEAGLQSPQVQEASKNILLKRFGYTDEVAKVVSFLASDESSYITAQVINVNGGLYF
jgi:3-oxoacyl-[acyl-carrier protein] reductase